MPKVTEKEKILKAVREKQLVANKRAPIRTLADFWKDIFQSGRDKQEIFKVMESKDL